MKSQLKKLNTRILASIILAITSCSSEKESEPQNSEDSLTLQSKEIITIHYRPLLVSIGEDKTGSTVLENSLVPNDLSPLIQHLYESGGGLAYTGIADKALPLVRLTVNISQKPVPPAIIEENNVYLKYTKESNQEEERKEYNIEMQKWQRNVANNINFFNVQLSEYINLPKTYLQSAIHEAINRMQIFLCEPHVSYDNNLGRYMVLVTDLENNVPVELQNPKCNITYLIVNGKENNNITAEHIGEYLQFENIASAIRYIVDKEKSLTQNSIK